MSRQDTLVEKVAPEELGRDCDLDDLQAELDELEDEISNYGDGDLAKFIRAEGPLMEGTFCTNFLFPDGIDDIVLRKLHLGRKR